MARYGCSTGHLVAILGLLLGARGVRAQTVLEWSDSIGGVAVAVDRSNNVFTVSHQQALGAEMTVTKRDVTGVQLWQSSFDQTDPTKWERASWIDCDAAGNAVICGTLMSGYSNPVAAASVVVKFDPAGVVLWRRVYDSPFDGSSTRKGLVDPQGNIYVVGLGNGPQGMVTRIRKFAPDGTTLWTWYDVDGIGAPTNLKFSPEGNLLVAGRGTSGSVNGYAKVDAQTGARIWGRGGVLSFSVGDCAGDSSGNSWLVHGEFLSTVGTRVKKLDASGTQIFDLSFPLSAFRVEVGPDDLAVFCGFPNQNGGAAFFKLDPQGNPLWANLDADGPLQLLLHARLRIDASNDAYLAAGTLFEMALCKVNADGTSAWTRTVPGSYANDFTFGSFDRSLFLTGGTTVRLTDPAEGPWKDLGRGLGGVRGVPHLFGQGTLFSGAPFTLDLERGPTSAAAVLGVGFTSVNQPLLGGILVPAPDVVVTGLQTDAQGAWQLPLVWPAGVPGGFRLYLQSWIADSGAVAGVAASNALEVIAP